MAQNPHMTSTVLFPKVQKTTYLATRLILCLFIFPHKWILCNIGDKPPHIWKKYPLHLHKINVPPGLFIKSNFKWLLVCMFSFCLFFRTNVNYVQLGINTHTYSKNIRCTNKKYNFLSIWINNCRGTKKVVNK